MPHNRRLPAELITPAHEDAGIFKNPVGHFRVELVPMFGHTQRRDLVIKGYLPEGTAIEVVFPGRRTAQTEQLCDTLRAFWRRTAASARYARIPVEIENARLPARLEGAWRARFERDDMGWQTRNHQLYVARWTLVDTKGTPVTFGDPVVR